MEFCVFIRNALSAELSTVRERKKENQIGMLRK